MTGFLKPVVNKHHVVYSTPVLNRCSSLSLASGMTVNSTGTTGGGGGDTDPIDSPSNDGPGDGSSDGFSDDPNSYHESELYVYMFRVSRQHHVLVALVNKKNMLRVLRKNTSTRTKIGHRKIFLSNVPSPVWNDVAVILAAAYEVILKTTAHSGVTCATR